MASGESRHSRIDLRASVTVLALLWSCEASGFYRGVVVDVETNERLAGVVVVVLWQKKPIICMDCPLYFHNVKEDVTDVNGGFYIDASPGINFNPFTRVVDPPSVIEASRAPNHLASRHDDGAAAAEFHEIDLLIGGAQQHEVRDAEVQTTCRASSS